MTDLTNLCPCCSMKKYDHCCKLFHEGTLPENALQLMRSRYTAYVLNIPDYIMATTHPANPQYSKNKLSWKHSISQFSKTYSFHKLKILDFKENENLATVTFTAYLSQGPCDATFTEKSYFEQIDHQWLYRHGQLAQGHVPHIDH